MCIKLPRVKYFNMPMRFKHYFQNNSTAKYTFLLSGLTIICTVAFIWWLLKDPSRSFATNVPGMDKRFASASSENNKVIKIGEHFTAFEAIKSALTETWPRFRGENFDNISKSGIKLIDKFGDIKKRIRWSVELGEGHAGAAIYKGAVYVLDYDEAKHADMLKCFSLTDGKESWRRWYDTLPLSATMVCRELFLPVSEKYILSIGPRCDVMCVDRENGNFRWGIDIEKEYSTEVPLWYTGQCALTG